MSQFMYLPKNINVTIVVDDEAYERMLTTLKAGEPFVKTYFGKCPHRSPRMCKCSFRKNVLVNNEIMRDVNGKMEKVWCIRQILALCQ